MQKLSSNKFKHGLIAFTPLSPILDQMIMSRRPLFLSMSGYPRAHHVVGAVQREIKTDSITALLNSIKRLRDLAHLASETLFNIPLLRADREQTVRSELSTFLVINQGNAMFGSGSLSAEDINLATYLIVSSETNASNWTLEHSDEADNLHVKIQKLYESLLSSNIDPAKTPVFDVIKDEIVSFDQSTAGKTIAKSFGKAGKSKDEAVAAAHKSACSTVHVAHVRLVDHIYGALTSTDLWDSFITPRKSIDPSQNEERAKSLRVLSSYLHSLLIYHSIFAVELFHQTVNKLGRTLVTFPALPEHVQSLYKQIVLDSDTLGIVQDVSEVLASVDIDASNPHGVPITGFISDVTQPLDMESTLNEAKKLQDGVATLIPVGSLQSITTDSKFLAVMMCLPIGKYEMIYNLAEKVISGDAIAKELHQVSASLNSAIQIHLTPQRAAYMRDLNLRPNLAMVGNVNFIPDPCHQVSTTTTLTSFKPVDGVLLASYDLKKHLRKDRFFQTFSSSGFMKDAKTYKLKNGKESTFYPRFAVLDEERSRLAQLMRITTPGYGPTGLFDSEYKYYISSLVSDSALLKEFMFRVTGDHYELIKRTISSPFRRELYATLLSGVALLFATDETSNADYDPRKDANYAAKLVVGYGKPYGCDYTALNAKQGSVTSESPFVKIVDGVFLRFLTQIPLPEPKLNIEMDFFSSHPRYYYPGNSATMPVDRICECPVFWQFALVPYQAPSTVQTLLYDRKMVYLNDAVYLQSDFEAPLDANLPYVKPLTLHPTEKPWTHNRFATFSRFVVPFSYGKATAVQTNEQIINETLKATQEYEKEYEKLTTAELERDKTSEILPKVKIDPEHSSSVDDAEKASINSSKKQGKKDAKHNSKVALITEMKSKIEEKDSEVKER